MDFADSYYNIVNYIKNKIELKFLINKYFIKGIIIIMPEFTKSSHNVDIEYFIHQYETGNYILPSWQRMDCWSLDYKQKLIKSILLGIDIPKIYIGEIGVISGIDTKYIIDGGHRTRAICGFKNNEIHINHNGQELYYNLENSHETRNRGVLSVEDLNIFKRFELNITKYTNITEDKCREIFNLLQNAEPMTVPDIINSHQSYLIDYLRQLIISPSIFNDDGYNFSELYKHYKKTFSNQNNNEELQQLVSFYTIVNPIRVGDDIDYDDEQIAMRYLEKGKTRDSKCLKYVRNHNIPISEVDKETFEAKVQFIMDCLHEKKNMVLSDVNSLLYAKCWYEEFDEDSFYDLIDSVNEYSTLKNKANKCFKSGDTINANIYQEQALNLNNEYEDDVLESWKTSRTSGGSNERGMIKRNEIIKLYC